MGDQTQAYDIFQTPLSSGYPLHLRKFSSRARLMCALFYDDVSVLVQENPQMPLVSMSWTLFNHAYCF
jgi:hypothetical protein